MIMNNECVICIPHNFNSNDSNGETHGKKRGCNSWTLGQSMVGTLA